MTQTVIATDRAPKAIGPYVQARKVGGFLFASGQIALDPTSGLIVEGGIEAQTKRALANMKAVVEAGGGTLESIVKTTLFLKEMDHFGTVNTIYGEFFGAHKPARSTVEVAALPKGALFEIECIAAID